MGNSLTRRKHWRFDLPMIDSRQRPYHRLPPEAGFMRIMSVQRMRNAIGVTVMTLMVVSGSACRAPISVSPPTDDRQVSPGMVPVQSLAHQLGLNVSRASRHVALLEDQRNHLLILGPPNASVTLNGQTLSEWRVVSARNTLYVWGSLADNLKPLLAVEPRVTVRPRPRPTPRPQPVSPLVATVILDAGHGGKDIGAPGRYGPDEKHIALDTTLRIAKALRGRGVNVVLTRRNDTYPTLPQRIALANRLRPNLFVSIHADSAPNRQARGFTIYAARQASSQSLDAAGKIAQSLKAVGVHSRGVRRADFDVLAQTNCPSVLVELGYLTNRTEARKLNSSAYRQNLARAIAGGVTVALRAQQARQ